MKARNFVGGALMAGVGIAGIAETDVMPETPEPIVEIWQDTTEAIDEFDLNAVSKVVLDAVETAGAPILFATGVLAGWTITSRKRFMMSRIAIEGYSDDPSHLRRILAGMVAGSLGIASIATGLMIRDEIVNGPTRVIDSFVERTVAGTNESKKILGSDDILVMLRDGTDHYQNDSRISRDKLEAILNDPRLQPYYRTLVNATTPSDGKLEERQAAMVLAVPGDYKDFFPEISTDDAICKLVEQGCILGPRDIIADRKERKIGDVVEFRGKEYVVVAHPTEEQSFTNREVIWMPEQGYIDMEQNPEPDYYGIISIGIPKEDLEKMLAEAGIQNDYIDILNIDEFKGLNREFWEKAVTSLIMVLYAASFSYAVQVSGNAKRDEFTTNEVAINSLRTRGYTASSIGAASMGRSMVSLAAAFPIGFAVTESLSKAANKGIVGFNSDPNWVMYTAAGGSVIMSQIIATAYATWKLARQEPGRVIK